MTTFLIVVAGVLVAVMICLTLGIWWLKRKLKGLGKALAAICGGGMVPPFRVSLVSCPQPEWSDPDEIEAITTSFENLGYQKIEDYEVPEMEGVVGRAFCHRDDACYAFVYQHPEAGLVADVALEFADGSQFTVTSSSPTGLDRPPHAPTVHMEVDLTDESAPSELHGRAVAESSGREKVPVRSAEFAEVFVESYTQEMDWRIARGGVSADEVRRTAEVANMEPPDECAVSMVQDIWRGAIDEFIQEEVQKTWLADSDMSALEWESNRDRLLVIHDRTNPEDKIDELVWPMVAGTYPEEDDVAEDRAIEAAKARLTPLFEGGSVREGFRQAQDLLPEKQRYQHVASLDHPWPADLYLTPESGEEL